MPSIRYQMTGENAAFQSEFKKIRLKIEIEVKMGEEKPHSKTKFDKLEENFTILEEKIHSIRFEMTGDNGESSNQFNEIRLKMSK